MPGLSLNAILLSAVALLAPSAEAVDAGRHDSELGAVEVTPVVGGLAYPWAVAFLPDNQGMLVTERPGSLRFVSPEGQLSAPLEGVPRVFASGQGPARRRLVAGVRRGPAGLPDLCRGRRGRPRRNGGGTRPVIGGQATAGGFPRDLPAVAEAFQRPSLRLAPGLRRQGPPVHRPRREQPAQHLAGPGQVAGQDRPPVSGRRRSQDNPFVGRTDARPEIWSYGHRNQQGAALNPWTGQLWTHEHGRAAATRSTYPRPAGTTAGRWRPMESTTPCCRSPKPGARPSTVPRRRTMSGRSRRRSAAWRSTMRSASRPGSTICSSARWRRRN